MPSKRTPKPERANPLALLIDQAKAVRKEEDERAALRQRELDRRAAREAVFEKFHRARYDLANHAQLARINGTSFDPAPDIDRLTDALLAVFGIATAEEIRTVLESPEYTGFLTDPGIVILQHSAEAERLHQAALKYLHLLLDAGTDREGIRQLVNDAWPDLAGVWAWIYLVFEKVLTGGVRRQMDLLPEIDESGTPPPAAKQSEGGPPLTQYVTLDQMAAIANRSKKTLERLKTRNANPLPAPDVEGGGGRPDEWRWDTVRPWLETEYKKKLPDRYPSAVRS